MDNAQDSTQRERSNVVGQYAQAAVSTRSVPRSGTGGVPLVIPSPYAPRREGSRLQPFSATSYFQHLTLPHCSVILLPSGQARRGRAFPTPPGSRDSNGTRVSLGAAGHLPGHPFMSTTRWVFILLALLAGAGIGIAYGWFVDPVDYFDLPPDTLRADYKADYVLMTAEAYQAEHDPGLAARRLAIFGTQSPSAIAADGLAYARTHSFSDAEIVLIQELVTALQAWSGIP